MSHLLVSENHHKVHHNHDFLTSHSSENKHQHDNKELTAHHSHEILTFLSIVFKTDDNQNDKEKLFFELKLDKHILPNKSINQQSTDLIKLQKNWFYSLKTNGLGLDVVTPPPKLISS